MFDGLEIDVLSVGDADCIVLTQWVPGWLLPQRVLVDGARASNVDALKESLIARGFTDFWAAVATHTHSDHAGGLIRIVEDKRFTFHNSWMHDIRKHIGAEALRRASSGNSAEAAGVKEVIDTTERLDRAFRSRRLTPQEPFSGTSVAGYPNVLVLGPTQGYYESLLREFTGTKAVSMAALFSGVRAVPSSAPALSSSLMASLAGRARPSGFAGIASPVPSFLGALRNSSVKESPTTQPFNNTSAILGIVYAGQRILLTGDAGSDALVQVPSEWKNLSYMQVPHHGSDGNLSQALIERFCPGIAFISACGDDSHPDRAIVSGLIKVGAQVASTHHGDLWFRIGQVPARTGYGPVNWLKGTGNPRPVLPSNLWDSLSRI